MYRLPSSCFCYRHCDRTCEWLDHHKTTSESLYRHPWCQPYCKGLSTPPFLTIPVAYRRRSNGSVMAAWSNPVSIIILLLVVLIGWFILARTKFGAHLYGVGGNSEVARLFGVRTDRVLIGAHVLCSVTAVLSGIFLVSLMRSGAPWWVRMVCTI